MAARRLSVLLAVAALISILTLAQAASFNESCPTNVPSVPCTSHVSPAPGTANLSLSDLAGLYGLTVPLILAANGLPPSTDNSTVLRQRVNVPVSCACMNGTLRGNSVVGGNSVMYMVKPNDFLSAIADRYGGLVTYQEIAAANNISDPNKIFPNQTLVIPLPCACRSNSYNDVGASYLAYAVAKGESLAGIAAAHNRTSQELVALNKLNGTEIQAGQVLMVPLQACLASGFRSDALDKNLVVPGGGYAITGAGCVQCACPKNSTQLSCKPAPDATGAVNRTGICMTRCSNSSLELGGYTTRATPQGCLVDSCVYQGYTIMGTLLTSEITNNTSGSCSSVPPPPAFAYAPEAEEALAPGPDAGGAGGGTPGTPGTPGSGTGGAPAPQSSARKNGVTMLALLLVAAAAVLH